MSALHKSYYSEWSSASVDWFGSTITVSLGLALTLIFVSGLRVVGLAGSESFEFGAMVVGLICVGAGLIWGARGDSKRDESRGKSRGKLLEVFLAALVGLEASGLYFFGSELLGFISAGAGFGAVFLLLALPLWLGFFVCSGILGSNFGAGLKKSEGNSSVEFLLALILGVTFGSVIVSSSMVVMGVPILLLIASGVLLSCVALAKVSGDGAWRQFATLAFVGVFAVALIAQVLLGREEQLRVEKIAFAETNASESGSILWSYGAQWDVEVDEGSSGAFEFFRELTQDSVSVLVVDGGVGALADISGLNCAEVSLVNESPLLAALVDRGADRIFGDDENFVISSYEADAFDFMMSARRRWDVIYLPRVSTGAQAGLFEADMFEADLLEPALCESEQYFNSCLSHLTEGGFVAFEVNQGSGSLKLYQRLTAISSALRYRGIDNPYLCFASLQNSDGLSDLMLIGASEFSESIGHRISLAAELSGMTVLAAGNGNSASEVLACFQSEIEESLSSQYELDLSSVTLSRPFPAVLRPELFSFAEPVHAQALGGSSQIEIAGSSALYDALVLPTGILKGRFEEVLIIMSFLVLIAMALSMWLGRRALNATLHAERRRQRFGFLTLVISVTGFLFVMFPMLLAYDLHIRSLPFFPSGLEISLLLLAFGFGLWFSGRKRNQRRIGSLFLALIVSLLPMAFSDLVFVGVRDSSIGSFAVSLIPLLVSPALFGMIFGLLLRRLPLKRSGPTVRLFSAILFSGLGALLVSRLLTMSIGFGASMELGLLVLGIVGVLQILRPLKSSSISARA